MRWPLFVQTTPFVQTPEVRLYEDTWNSHILPSHQEVKGELVSIQNTVADPQFVVAGSEPGHFVFVSGVRQNERNRPLLVVVSTNDTSGYSVVATSYFGSVTYLDPHQTKYPVHFRKT